MTRSRTVLMLAFWACAAAPVLPCSVSYMWKPTELVDLAEVIVRARAVGLSPEPGRPDGLGGSDSQVVFEVISVLKGSLPATHITFNGWLVPKDERNGRPVPYSAARHSADASCFALGYRQGAQYLLFLRRTSHAAYAQRGQLTPYWAALAPSNEQLFGATDPWETWVREQLRLRRRDGERPGV